MGVFSQAIYARGERTSGRVRWSCFLRSVNENIITDYEQPKSREIPGEEGAPRRFTHDNMFRASTCRHGPQLAEDQPVHVGSFVEFNEHPVTPGNPRRKVFECIILQLALGYDTFMNL